MPHSSFFAEVSWHLFLAHPDLCHHPRLSAPTSRANQHFSHLNLIQIFSGLESPIFECGSLIIKSARILLEYFNINPIRPMARLFIQPPLTLFQIMKNAGFRSFFHLFCLLFSIGFSGGLFGNDNSQPLSGIGSTLQIAEETFDWQYAEDDGTYRFDIYVSSGYSVYVTSVLDAGEFALASGTSASGGVSGLVMFGAGSEAYKPYSGTRSLTGPTSYYGWNYDSGQLTWQYYADLSSGNFSYTYTESWTSPTGSISLWGDLYGMNSWSMAHADSGTQYSPSSGQNSLQLFGGDYLFTYGTYYWSVSASGDNVGPTWSDEYNSWQDYYSNAEGGSAQVYWNNFIPDTTLVGWDPYMGDFYGYNSFAPLDLTTIWWNGRGGSTFTAGSGQVWVKQDSEINYRLMNFAWGEVKSSGQVTDSFVHGENELSLMIDGNVKAFQTGQAPADVRMDGVLIGTVSLNGFDVTASGWDIQTSDPGTIVDEPFFLSTTTLWVNGTPFAFDHGHLNSTGDRTDIYNHESLGSVTLSGIDIDQFNASVLVTGSSSGSGAFSSGVFSVSGVTIETAPPLGSEAFWVRGQLYKRVADGSNTFNSSYYSLTLSVADENTTNINGADSIGGFSGSFPNDHSGVFLIEDGNLDVLNVPVIPVNADGTMRLSSDERPPDVPPALMVVCKIWVYLGTAADDTTSGHVSAYYGRHRITDIDPGPALVKIRTDESGDLATVTHTDYPAAEHKTGIYHKQTHLFQTGASGSLPMPLYAVHGPCQNSQVWNLPEPEGDWPASFLVGGQTWRFKGMNGTLPLYQGYYYDQVLSVTAPTTPGGNFTVHVTGLPGGDSEGLLNGLRGSVRLANGTMVYSGDFDGDLINPGPNTSLYTIAGDLDITGNVVSFGALNGGIAMAGVTMQFMDADASATLQSIVNRQQAQWAWSRAGSNDASEILPVMQLDSLTGLTLRDPENPSTVAIQLNPSANTITINNSSVLTMSSADDLYVRKDQVGGGSGMILTQDGADLRYLRIEQLSGNGNGGGSAVVLTQDIADARYLPASQPTLNNSPVLSQQAADARYLPVSQPALNNSPVLSQQAADARYLPVSGPMLNNSPVLSQQAADARYLPASGPTLNNSPVLSQDAADGRYLRSGQTLRVLPAGDIGMGEFTQGTPPGTPPEEE